MMIYVDIYKITQCYEEFNLMMLSFRHLSFLFLIFYSSYVQNIVTPENSKITLNQKFEKKSSTGYLHHSHIASCATPPNNARNKTIIRLQTRKSKDNYRVLYKSMGKTKDKIHATHLAKCLVLGQLHFCQHN